MKPTTSFAFPLLACTFAAPAAADVIYSNLQNISIPKDNNGVYLNVLSGTYDGSSSTDWHINPTFGGINVYNNGDFQPLRVTNSGAGTLSNIPAGGLIQSGSNYFATGMGASGDHLSSTFTAGAEGYIGFSVANGASTHYGWMRVVFTGTGDPRIRDWAYDTGGGSIAAGNVLQSGSTYILDSSTQSFSLGSSIKSSNSVLKTGANTVTLNTTNSYTGTTTISNGTLALAASGSIADSSVITVGTGGTLNAGAISGGWTLETGQKLTGGGGVSGDTLIKGTHNAGDPLSNSGVGSQALAGSLTYATGSIFEWDLNTSSTATGFDTVSATEGVTAQSGSIFHVVLGDTVLGELGGGFWNSAPNAMKTWSMAGIFGSNFSGAFTTVTTHTDVSSFGSFSISGTSLTWTAIPEPGTALAGLLLTAGILRRRR
jgi:autotransporter-associated beta strand protein